MNWHEVHKLSYTNVILDNKKLWNENDECKIQDYGVNFLHNSPDSPSYNNIDLNYYLIMWNWNEDLIWKPFYIVKGKAYELGWSEF